MDKATLRSIMKQKRLLVKPETFLSMNEIITQKVLSHPQYQKAHTIGFYVSLPQEVQTFALIQKALLTHRVCVPKVNGDVMHFYEISSLKDLKEGCFHVLEPMSKHMIQPTDIDLMIVPMLSYDKELYRLGYGKGYYDKYFVSGFQGYKLGLAFSFQYVDHIERDEYDQKLDEVITDE